MTDEPALPELRAALTLAEARLATHTAQAKRWREIMQRSVAPVEKVQRRRHQAQSQLKAALARVAQDERDIASLEEQIMRHADDETAPAPAQPGMRLYANRTLQIGEKVFQRGQEIDPNDLIGTANGSFLVERGYCGYRFPAVPKADNKVVKNDNKVVTSAAVTKASPISDPIIQFALLVQTIMDERALGWFEAQDLAGINNSNLYQRAVKMFVEERAEVRDGEFGSGGGGLTQSGAGTSRRIFNPDRFRERLRLIVAQHKQPQEAA